MKAGTRLTPPESGTVAASSSSARPPAMPSSRAVQSMAAPEATILPSWPYMGPSVSQARVVDTPRRMERSGPEGIMTEEPVP